MRRNFIYLMILINIIFLTAHSEAANEPQRRFVEELLIVEGLDPSQARRILQDSRISIRPDIIIQNLFYSKPRGTRQNPDVMEIETRQITQGISFMKQNADVLNTVEKRFGTSPRIITAILIIESRLGTYKMRYHAATAYANLAFMLDPDYFKKIQDRYGDIYPQLYEDATIARAQRKARWALGELYFLVHIANHLNVDPVSMTGSFAGALGPGQFIPSSFWIFGMDGDGDGLANPFNMTDATLSMGNYLRKYGWREDAPLEQKRKAIWYYNHSDVYVNTVMMIYEKLGRY